MYRRVIVASAAAALCLVASPAFAQPSDANAHTADETDASPTEPDNVAHQELGARLGLAGGGRVTPGGLYVGGAYLYRLTDSDWFEGGVAFSFGGGDRTCFRDRANAMVCDQGSLSGFGGEVSAGVRRYFLGKGNLTPYARAGISLRFVNFGSDDLKGVGLPLWIGGGVRARVANGVHVVGDASLHAGPSVMGKRLGFEPQLSIVVLGGVEFRID